MMVLSYLDRGRVTIPTIPVRYVGYRILVDTTHTVRRFTMDSQCCVAQHYSHSSQEGNIHFQSRMWTEEAFFSHIHTIDYYCTYCCKQISRLARREPTT